MAVPCSAASRNQRTLYSGPNLQLRFGPGSRAPAPKGVEPHGNLGKNGNDDVDFETEPVPSGSAALAPPSTALPATTRRAKEGPGTSAASSRGGELNRPVAFLLVLILGGCASYQAKPLSPERSAAAFGARSLADPGLRHFVETGLGRPFDAWPPARWDFSTLMLVAFYEHPDLDVARARWATAQAGRLTARQRPNPTVGFQPAYDTTTPPPWILGLALDIPIETAGKRGYRIAQAEQLSEAARLSIATTAWQVRSRLRDELLAWRAARQASAALQEQEANQTEVVRLLEGQLQLGAVSGFVLSQARLGLSQTRLALQDATQRRDVTFARVASAAGLPVGALDGATFDLEELEALPSDPTDVEARRQALVNRADVRAALAEYAAADAALRLEIARQYPDLRLGPGYQRDQTDNKWSLGLTLELPLFSRNKGPIAEAEARREELAASFGALQAGVLSQIEQALAGYRVAREKADTARRLLEDSRRQEEASSQMLRVGEISPLELAQRKVELGAASLAAIDAGAAARQALGALEDALQSPLGLPDSLWEKAPREAVIGREQAQ
jgi:cobalt-zinc-cadmium efflux system outer membrane protein